MLLEAMGLHVPGTAFVHPGTPLREALTREAARTRASAMRRRRQRSARRSATWSTSAPSSTPWSALLATGGSTNHLIHWVAVARAAGILIDWNDFAELSDVVPLLARVYPNGSADVNQFQAAGGPGFVIRELLDAGLLHERRAHRARPAACARYTPRTLARRRSRWPGATAPAAPRTTPIVRAGRGSRSAPTAA